MYSNASKMMMLQFLLIALSFTGVTHGGNFVVWIPMSSKSVKIGVMEVGEELARRGHEVTVISPHPYKKVPPGVTEITIKNELFDTFLKKTSDDVLSNPGTQVSIGQFIQMSLDLNKLALERDDVQKVLERKDIDVLISVPAFANEVSHYLAYRSNASIVTMLTASFSIPNINFAVGESYNPSYMPNPMLGYTQNMNFYQRCVNTAISAIYLVARKIYILPQAENLLSEVYKSDSIPSLDELSKNTALVINHGTPFTGDGARPVMAKTIMAGLMSCSPAKPLPEDLEKYINDSPHGVIFVSFGSVLQASKMPEPKRKAMLEAFSKLKQRVIWKWETTMEDAPSNVKISSWLPQTSLLAHKNVKLFVTHGGAGSIQETICHKTPIIGVPMNGDQIVNIKETVNKNVGLQVDWHDMTGETLHKAIMTVLENPIYQNSVTELSDLIMDQPQHPLDRSIWWLEYLLRHPKNLNMRPVTHDLYWFQYFLLDVMGFFLLIIGSISYIIISICKLCCCKTKSKQD